MAAHTPAAIRRRPELAPGGICPAAATVTAVTSPAELSDQVRAAAGAAWAWLTHPDPPPDHLPAALIAAAALAAVLIPVLWRLTRPAAAWTHEAGHAVAAATIGGRITGLRIGPGGSGNLTYTFPSDRSTLLVAGAGYPAPALLAVALAASYTTGHPRAGLTAVAALAAILAGVSRGWRAWLWTAAVAVSAALAAGHLPAQACLGAAVFLAAAAVRCALEDAAAPPGDHDDAAAIATRIPITRTGASAWLITVCIAAAAIAAAVAATAGP